MPSIFISPAGASDAADLHAIRAAAYKDSVLHSLFLPTPMSTQQHKEYQAYQLQLMKSKVGVAQGRFYFKAVDDSTGEAVGFSCWVAPKKHTESSDDGDGGAKVTRPDFINAQVIEGIEGQFAKAREEILGERSDDVWYLAAMCIRPELQRCGIGDQLVKQGIRDLVDNEGSDCYLESSEAGVKMYTRNGFKPEMSMPLVDSNYVSTAMLRKASTQAQ